MSGKTDMGGAKFACVHEAAQTGNDEQLWDSLDALDTEDLRALLLCKFGAKSDAEAWHDYAAAALTGLVANASVRKELVVSETAGQLADQMLTERTKRTEGQS